MSVRIRLSRHGRKNAPFYHIIVADARAPRNGRFIERLGSYNPMTDPATIDLDVDRCVLWLNRGAQPTLTTKRILSYKGVLLKKHLLLGVQKGAFSLEEAEKRFAAWLQEKQSKIDAKISKLASDAEATKKARHEAEAKVNAARAEAIAQKRRVEAEAKSAAESEATQEAPAEGETPAAEEPAAE